LTEQRSSEAADSQGVPSPRSTSAAVWRWLRHAELESRGLTTAFWLAVAAFTAAFWVTPFPPCIDYPQHLALGAILGRLLDSQAPEHALYEVSLLSYNGLFQVLVAGLSLVVRPEVAGKLLLSLVPLLTAVAGLALARVGRRPLWTAFFILPFSYGHILGWGFVNYCLATPLALLVFTWWLRWQAGERGLLGRVIVGSLVVAYAHALVTVCLCISVALGFFGSSPPREIGLRRWLIRLAKAPLPVLPAVLYTALVFVHHRAQPNFFWAPAQDGSDIPAWEKLRDFSTFAVGNLFDRSDELLFRGLCVVLLLLWLAPRFVSTASEARPRPELVWLAVGWAALYVLVPRWVVSTAYIFERIPIWLVAFAAAAVPLPGARLSSVARNAAAGLGLLAGVNTLAHFARIPGAKDADAIIDDIPEGARVVAVMHASDGAPAIWRRIWVHLVAYHLVRRPGEIAFSFTRYASLPVRYRQGRHPPWYAGGIEWYPSLYDPTAEYMGYFTTVLVKTPDAAPDADPRELTFGPYASGVRLLSRRGRYFLYDAEGIWGTER